MGQTLTVPRISFIHIVCLHLKLWLGISIEFMIISSESIADRTLHKSHCIMIRTQDVTSVCMRQYIALLQIRFSSGLALRILISDIYQHLIFRISSKPCVTVMLISQPFKSAVHEVFISQSKVISELLILVSASMNPISLFVYYIVGHLIYYNSRIRNTNAYND